MASGAVLVALAWRLGADVAVELQLPAGRARTLAVEIKAALFVDLKLLHPVIFLRLAQGLIRKRWDT